MLLAPSLNKLIPFSSFPTFAIAFSIFLATSITLSLCLLTLLLSSCRCRLYIPIVTFFAGPSAFTTAITNCLINRYQLSLSIALSLYRQFGCFGFFDDLLFILASSIALSTSIATFIAISLSLSWYSSCYLYPLLCRLLSLSVLPPLSVEIARAAANLPPQAGGEHS